MFLKLSTMLDNHFKSEIININLTSAATAGKTGMGKLTDCKFNPNPKPMVKVITKQKIS